MEAVQKTTNRVKYLESTLKEKLGLSRGSFKASEELRSTFLKMYGKSQRLKFCINSALTRVSYDFSVNQMNIKLIVNH